MKIIRIMSLFSSIFALFSCQAQDKGFESLSVEAFRQAIAVNCRSGKRSKKAAGILVKNGYKVIELDSGYNGWVKEGN